MWINFGERSRLNKIKVVAVVIVAAAENQVMTTWTKKINSHCIVFKLNETQIDLEYREIGRLNNKKAELSQR